MDHLEAWVEELRPDVIGIAESWADDGIGDAELHLHGYDMFRQDRPVARGAGGVLLYVRADLRASAYKPETQFPEQVWCYLKDSRDRKFYIGVCYRTPTADIFDGLNHELLRTLLGEFGSTGKHFLLMGDFNYRFDRWPVLSCDGLTADAERFITCLDDNFLCQHVTAPTRGDRILDLVVTDGDCIVDDVERLGPLGGSDHGALGWLVEFESVDVRGSRWLCA